ncbi:hypothetical protein SAMN05428963_11084 [Consotaella salsifontis]|uniref:Uncharacterized protein n=2 Tax=Consotaella salsifontis TaxID=1365950 RepID=A0A1T4SE47_9HYPH|nr:hypothetical protein SAMN05428963_11084 [Consotaella salsifontis]
MNEEIIRTLEKEYPEPWPLDVRLRDIATLMGAFRKVRGYEGAIDAIAEQILETAEAIANGQVPEVDGDVRKHMRRDLAKWRDQIYKREKAREEAIEYSREELDDEDSDK